MSSSKSTNLMDPVSSMSVHSCFVKVLPFDVMVVGSSITVTRPVMFTLLLAFSFAIISCMLSVDSLSSCSSSVISVKSNVISLLLGSDSLVLLLMCTSS